MSSKIPAARPLPAGFNRYSLELSQGPINLISGGDGPPLVMVHGLGGSAEDFYDLAPLLGGRRTLVMPDLYGHGFSAMPDVDYTIPFFADTVAEVFASLGLTRTDFLGHSMGGHIALYLALNQPEKFRRLALICPSGGQAGPRLEQRILMRVLSGDGESFRFYHTCITRALVRRLFADPKCPQARALEERQVALWSGPDRPLRERALVRSANNIFKDPLWPEAGKLKVPAMMVTGEVDAVIVAEETDRLARNLPKSTVHHELDLGHMLPYTRPEPLAKLVLDFLDG